MGDSSFRRIHFSSEPITTCDGDSIILIHRTTSISLVDADAISRAENVPLPELCTFLFDSHAYDDEPIKLTPLHKLHAKFIVSSPLPEWKGGGWDEDVSLATALKLSLQKSVDDGCTSIVISTEGIASSQFPSNRHVRVAVGQTHQFLALHENVTATFIGEEAQSIYLTECSRQNQICLDSNAIVLVKSAHYGLKCISGSIVSLRTDAIVNAANNALRPGGGVDGAIHRAAGPLLAKACKDLGGCATGDSVATDGYMLPASYVIHAVGPIWSGGQQDENQLLASCYMSSLEKAVGLGCQSVAFPAISCGVYGFPKERAVKIAIQAVQTFRELTWSDIKVYFSCYGSAMAKLYQNELQHTGNEAGRCERSNLSFSEDQES